MWIGMEKVLALQTAEGHSACRVFTVFACFGLPSLVTSGDKHIVSHHKGEYDQALFKAAQVQHGGCVADDQENNDDLNNGCGFFQLQPFSNQALP